MSRWMVKGLLSVLMLFFAACGATTQTAPQKGEAALVAKVDPTEDKMLKENEEERTASLPIAEERVVTPTPKKLPKVDVLMGKTPKEIEMVFGRPVLLRKDKPAEVWQYLTSECALHLIFYPAQETDDKGLTVQHISMNERREVVPVDPAKCFGSQLRKVGEDRAQALS